MNTVSSNLSHGDLTFKTRSWFYARRSQNCEVHSPSKHVLLSALLTYGEGPVLQLNALSHFLTFVRGKIECWLAYTTSFRLYPMSYRPAL